MQTTVGTTLNATATIATANPGLFCDEAAATTATSTSITQKTLTNTTSTVEQATSTNNNEHRSSSTFVPPNIQPIYDSSSATRSPPKRISKKHLPTHGEITEAHAKVHLGLLHQANQQQVELKLKNLKEMQEQICTWGRDHICQKDLDAARNYEGKLNGKVVKRFQ